VASPPQDSGSTLLVTSIVPVTATAGGGHHQAGQDVTDVGLAVYFSAMVSGGAPPYVIAWNGLPSQGCSVNVSTNMPSAACAFPAPGTLNITVEAHDSQGGVASSPTLNFTVQPDPGATPPTASFPVMDAGMTDTLTVSPSSGLAPFIVAWNVTPAGACYTLSPGSGASTVYCTPASSGTLEVSDSFTDSMGLASPWSQAIAVPVYPFPSAGPVSFSSNPAFVGQPMSIRLSPEGGTGNFTYQWTGLPPGCAGAGSSIECRPSEAGNYAVSVLATDSLGSTTNSVATLTVEPTVLGVPVGTVELLIAVAAVCIGGGAAGWWDFRRRRRRSRGQLEHWATEAR